jgi:hypothetical protein
MTSATRQLRLIQAVCVILVLGCVVVVYLTASGEKRSATGVTQSVIVVLAAWSAIGDFTFQRKLLKKKISGQRATKSSTFMRWRAGHIARLWSAASVVVWGLLLWELGGSHLAANLLFGLGLLLLLIWSPGMIPAEE